MSDDIKIEQEDQKIEDKVKKLKEQLKKCQKEKEEYLAGWQRSKADFINARKDEEKKREEVVKFANQILIYDLLTVLDSFYLALKDSESKEGEQTKGFYLIKAQLDDVLKRHGLKAIKSVGEKFNPEFHESVAEVPSDKESGVVVEEIQKGYILHNQVIRPTRVKISK